MSPAMITGPMIHAMPIFPRGTIFRGGWTRFFLLLYGAGVVTLRVCRIS